MNNKVPKNILLTGATGFLGSHLVEGLLREGYRVSVLKRSTSNVWRIRRFEDRVKFFDVDRNGWDCCFQDEAIDTVIHTATVYGRDSESVTELIASNLQFPLKVLEEALHNHVACFFNTDTAQERQVSSYALSKKQFLEWLKRYQNRLSIVNMRLEHFYGPKDDSTKFVIWLIDKLVHKQKQIDLTEGRQKREFVYVSDVVDAYLLLIQKCTLDCGFAKYDLGSNSPVTIRQFVRKTREIVSAVLGEEISTILNFGAVPNRENEPSSINMNTKRIESLGWKPRVLLDEGLRRTIEWYIRAQGRIDK